MKSRLSQLSHYNRWLVLFFSLIAIANWWSCAAIKAPPGGPEDKTPPQLIGATPPIESTHVMETHFRFQFSEYILESSLTGGVTVFPRQKTEPKIIYDDDAVEVQLQDTLQPEQTYIITFTRKVTDEHKVPLAEDIQYAFSTGATIDHGMITGQVTTGNDNSVHLWKITGQADSLFFTFPDYIIRCAEDGSFRFRYLSPGNYRLLAVEKNGTGVPLSPGITAYGLPEILTIPVQSDTAGPYPIRLHKEIPALRVLKAVQYPGWAEVTFNTPPLPLPKVFFRDSLDFHPIPDPRDSLKLVVFSKAFPNSIQLIPKGAPESEMQSVPLSAPEEPDTNAVSLVSPGTALNFKPEMNQSPTIRLVFSKPLITPISPADLPLVYTSKDTTLFEARVNQESPLVISVKPYHDWQPNTNYFLTCPGTKLFALDSTQFKDSVLVIRIRTGPELGYGSLSGSITGEINTPVGIILKAAEKSGKSYRQVVNSPSDFHLNDLSEGAYLLSIYTDRDSSGNYTYGRAFPPAPAEYFFDYPDTIKIRANWETSLQPFPLREP